MLPRPGETRHGQRSVFRSRTERQGFDVHGREGGREREREREGERGKERERVSVCESERERERVPGSHALRMAGPVSDPRLRSTHQLSASAFILIHYIHMQLSSWNGVIKSNSQIYCYHGRVLHPSCLRYSLPSLFRRIS
jgi:hypothetical protein